MIINAPCKVNLYLAVLDKRQDGFHNIESLFVTLKFGDILQFKIKNTENNTLELTVNGPTAGDLGLFAEKNIIFKAVSLFREKTGFKKDMKINAEKHIPAGGGLGGGSSDAASTLLALNQMAGCPLDRIELLELGAVLGSDVPYFIHRIPAARVTGRGEIIDSLEPPSWYFVLVNPGFHSDTKTAFRLLEQYRSSNSYRERHQLKRTQERKEIGVCASSCGSWYNDFLPILPEKSTYNKIITQLTQLGAEFAGLSGSGSTCFGVFAKKEQADVAVSILSEKFNFVKFSMVENNF